MAQPGAEALPVRAGVGLRAPHHGFVCDTLPKTGWFEGHSENFFAAGGESLRVLATVRQHYPVSLHGVGLSLGSVAGLDKRHLEKLADLVARIEPAAVSEHLCWSAVGGQHLNDLLPLPWTREALAVVCANVSRTQDFLKRAILVENVSSYLQFAGAEFPEWAFVAEVARRTGCGILLDVNNIWVSACNHGFDPAEYLAAMPPAAVQEIHLAGFEADEEGSFLVDTHSRPVHAPVWRLYAAALAHCGPKPTLIEWDKDIPAFDVLLNEAHRADVLLNDAQKGARAIAV